MKKKHKRIIAISAAAALLIGAVVWYLMPRTFLKNTEPKRIRFIIVADGNTGTDFTITDTENIRYIVENIKSCKMKRGKPSIGYMGYSYNVTFVGKNGKVVEEFIIDSKDTIRDDPFFYSCTDGELCIDYIAEVQKGGSQN